MTADIYIVVEDEGSNRPVDPEDPDDEDDDDDDWEDIPDEDTPLGENPDLPDDPGDSGGPYITPEVPKTGDDSPIAVCLVLLGISAFMLVLLVLDGRREKRK